MNLNLLQLSSNASLKEVLTTIEANHFGIIFGKDVDGRIIGLATDGDIRRKILSGVSLNETLDKCLNTDFIWADKFTSRETLLKKLDHKIRIIPILDENQRLFDIVTHKYFPTQLEDSIYVRAKSPVRISFGGGGSDLTHYFVDEPGAVINATINIYAHALLKVRNDESIKIVSSDLDQTIEAENLEELLKAESSFGLIQSTIKAIQPAFGFELYLNSDFPMKSGLGGSAVVSATVLGCFNQLRNDKFDSYELAELAYQAERVYQGIAGGWQDQYATIFGGINFMEFKYEKNQVYPLRVHNDIVSELEENLILCYTGMNHDSGDIHVNQKKEMSKSNVKELVKQNVALTYEIRDQLLRGKLFEFGNSLHQAWELKKQFGENISSKQFDDIYDFARNNGAIGGKILGAGGGGYFLFYCHPFRKQSLVKALRERGHEVRNFKFEGEGLKTWSIRESLANKSN
jgi:D-glycero-alpha-D-manno-heptose-7-phosphate kinase